MTTYVITDLHDGTKIRGIAAEDIKATLLSLYGEDDLDEDAMEAAYDVQQCITERRPYKRYAREALRVSIVAERHR